MNYVDDDWMDRFTDGQVTRMRDMVGAFRPELLKNIETESALEKTCTRVSRVL